MAVRNYCAIVDALEAMDHVMCQENQALQNQNGIVYEFKGLRKSYRNNTPSFKGWYDPKGA